MSALPNDDSAYMTPEEYLRFERASDTKHEYLDGDIFAMAGASRKHNLIVAQLSRLLGNHLSQRPCELYISDMQVQLANNYVYPDLSVVCGEPIFTDASEMALTNPIIIIEVLSPSTESYDRGEKGARYQRLTSLQEYVLIAQDSYRIEHYQRQNENQWLITIITQPEAHLHLNAIEGQFALTDIYERVRFETPHDQEPNT